MSRRDKEFDEIRAMLHRLEHNVHRIEHDVLRLLRLLKQDHAFPTSISFTEITMLPTTGGNTLVFTGTLQPAGAVYPSDATFTVTSNDPAVLPTVDATGLIVSVPLPSGWVESTTTPLALTYGAASASNPSMVISATITPSAPVSLPTGITFAQTT